jgi:hypothetical protein
MLYMLSVYVDGLHNEEQLDLDEQVPKRQHGTKSRSKKAREKRKEWFRSHLENDHRIIAAFVVTLFVCASVSWSVSMVVAR